MMNPRLYTTSYNKPQGQQFDDTAVLSFTSLDKGTQPFVVCDG